MSVRTRPPDAGAGIDFDFVGLVSFFFAIIQCFWDDFSPLVLNPFEDGFLFKEEGLFGVDFFIGSQRHNHIPRRERDEKGGGYSSDYLKRNGRTSLSKRSISA